MQLLLPFLAATILVTAQTFWKIAFSRTKIIFTKEFLASKEFYGLFFSSYFLLGALLYVLATFFYIYLFNKYSFYFVQSVMLVSAITLSFFIGKYFFNEDITVQRFIGLFFLIIGIIIVYKK